MAPGAAAPDSFSPFTTGTLELSVAATEPGATIVGSFFGFFGEILTHPEGSEGSVVSVTANPGLVINEVAAKGDPLDWFELYNSSSEAVALAGFLVADDLKEPAKRVAFPSELVVLPGEYMRIELDKDGWPGFALGGDEELGVWTADASWLTRSTGMKVRPARVRASLACRTRLESSGRLATPLQVPRTRRATDLWSRMHGLDGHRTPLSISGEGVIREGCDLSCHRLGRDSAWETGNGLLWPSLRPR